MKNTSTNIFSSLINSAKNSFDLISSREYNLDSVRYVLTCEFSNDLSFFFLSVSGSETEITTSSALNFLEKIYG